MLRAEVKILVVDDVTTIRSQIRSLLKSFGFQNVVVAESGLAAQSAISSETFHLVLCDWHMSPVNGLELLKFIRTNPRTQAMPFIMVSGENTMEKVIEAIHAGVDDYIVKPLTIEQIEEKVHKVLLRKNVLS